MKITIKISRIIKTHNISLAIAVALFLPVYLILAVPEVSYANAQQDICVAAGNSWDGTNCNATGVTVKGALTTTINVLSYIVGVASFIMIIVGGFRYVTSGGDANSAKSARSTILYAVVGLVVVVVAQAIVQFVLGAAT